VSFTFDPQRGLIIVRAELCGPGGSGVLRVALDTGATSTVVNVGFLPAIGYDTALISDRIQLTTGSGVEYAPRIVIQRVFALGQERLSFHVFGHTLPPSVSVDGLLGLDFLRDRTYPLIFVRAG
jgi:predicted aspartyl protease